MTKKERHYEVIEYTIDRILQSRSADKFSFDSIAKTLQLKINTFQNIFLEWCGAAPEEFRQQLYAQLSRQHIARQSRQWLAIINSSRTSQTNILSLSHNVLLEGMHPQLYENKGHDLIIHYNLYDSYYGTVIVATTLKGICYLSFIEEGDTAFDALRKNFPHAKLIQRTDHLQEMAIHHLNGPSPGKEPLPLFVKGTHFEIKVWETLLHIPAGSIISYATLAKAVNEPCSINAISKAIMNNPVAGIIPCHRVVHTTGKPGKYKWGSLKKAAIIGREASQKKLHFS